MMWSQPTDKAPDSPESGTTGREGLLLARQHMAQALIMLDAHSLSAAAASLDLAIHQLDRELSGR